MKTDYLELTPVQYSPSATKILRFKFSAGKSCFRPHWHDRMELLRVRSGNLRIEIGGETQTATKGGLIIIPPKVLHSAFAVGEDVDYDVLMFDVRSFYNDTDICKNILPAIFDGRADFRKIIYNPDAINCMDSICYKKDETFGTIADIYKLLGILIGEGLVEIRTQPKNAVINKMIEYLEDHFAEEVTVSDLCDYFGYSAPHLCRKFKDATGASPMKYLMIYRLESACKKIIAEDKSISNIAMEYGFSDSNYFARCFKKHFGVPPVEYRKKHSK